MKIDFNRSYGTVYGPSSNGAVYEQDGKPYDSKGNYVGKPVEPVKEPVKEPVMEPVKDVDEEPEKTMEQQVREMDEQGMTNTEISQAFGVTRQKITAILRS